MTLVVLQLSTFCRSSISPTSPTLTSALVFSNYRSSQSSNYLISSLLVWQVRSDHALRPTEYTREINILDWQSGTVCSNCCYTVASSIASLFPSAFWAARGTRSKKEGGKIILDAILWRSFSIISILVLSSSVGSYPLLLFSWTAFCLSG